MALEKNISVLLEGFGDGLPYISESALPPPRTTCIDSVRKNTPPKMQRCTHSTKEFQLATIVEITRVETLTQRRMCIETWFIRRVVEHHDTYREKQTSLCRCSRCMAMSGVRA